MTPGKPDRAGATRASRTWATATADARRRESRRILVASMAASIAMHAFLFSLGIAPSAATSPHGGAAPDFPGSRTPFNAPPGIRITRIVAGDPAVQTESPQAATEEPVPELTEPGLEDSRFIPAPAPDNPPPTSKLIGQPSVTRQGELPRAETGPAARIRPRFTNPALWREIRDMRTGAEWADVVPLRAPLDRRGSAYSPPDAWAFDTWATRDATGRRWGAGPGIIYLGRIAIRTCRSRFDASNCGFGLPGWRRREYQRFLQAVMEIEEQHRWGDILERGKAIRERGTGRHLKTDSIPDIRDGD